MNARCDQDRLKLTWRSQGQTFDISDVGGVALKKSD
jgi:hypothetical protein